MVRGRAWSDLRFEPYFHRLSRHGNQGIERKAEAARQRGAKRLCLGYSLAREAEVATIRDVARKVLVVHFVGRGAGSRGYGNEKKGAAHAS